MANIWRPAPSYHFRKDENLWRIVAPYVQQNDLYSACLVSSLFHHIFSPYLWANPACRFGSDCDGVYLALTRFKRLLKRTRLDVRRLAHTLHIPPAQPELYDGPQEGWLRDILDRLPSLQALIVSNLSFFDHQSLQVVHRSSGTPFENPTQYVLRLLIASHCENTTGTSLAVALSHFPDLIYLDLSSTRGARHPSVLRQIASLSYLRVLKLSHCGLRDDHVDYFAFGSSSHIRSLDVSHNFLTEKGITNLIGGLPGANLPFRWCENTLYNDYSSLSIRRKSVADTPIIGPLDDLESFVVQGLTSGFDGHLFIQDGLPAKFSHLYLACNDITVGGLSKLLQYPKLQFLDCGSLYCLEQPVELLSPGLPGSRRATYLEKLDPSSFIQAFKNVTSLRLHHAIITEYPFSDEDTTICPDSPKEGIFELSSDGLRYELDATNPDTSAVLHELEGSVGAIELQADVPQYELSADAATSIPKPLSILNSNTQRMNSRPHDRNGTTLESASPSTESNSARLLTPQSLEKAQSNAPKVVISDGFPTRDQLGHCQYTPSDIRSKNVSTPPSLVRPTKEVPVSGHEEHLNSYAVHEDFSRNLTQRESGTLNPQEIVIKLVQRQSQLQAERHPGRLKPSMLPNLETLILTDVPTMTRKCRVVEALRMFMQECAEQDELARLEARIANGTKPSRSEIKLKRLVLEMSSSPETLEPPKSPYQPRGKRGDSFTKTTKSSTEDADSEMFMEASEMDFTFFGEDDNSLLVSEGRVDSPRVVDDGMIFRETPTSPVDLEHPIDVISDLSSFRREKKAAHEKAMGLGMDRDPVRIALLGHWKGEVTVIRQQ